MGTLRIDRRRRRYSLNCIVIYRCYLNNFLVYVIMYYNIYREVDMKRISELRGYENVGDYYYITTCGKVISTFSGNHKMVKLQTNARGYKAYTFGMKEGKQKSKEVHRIVAIAFIDNPLDLPVVDHIDGNKGNPIATNLRWLTHSQNHIESIKLNSKGVFGKLDFEAVKDIRNIKEKEAVEKYNIHRSTYYKIKRGEIYAYVK